MLYSIYDGPTSFGTPMGPFFEPRQQKAPVGPFRRTKDTPDDGSGEPPEDLRGGQEREPHGPSFGLLAVDPDSFGRGYRRLKLRHAAMATGAFAMMSLGLSVQPPTAEIPRKLPGAEHTSEMRKPAKKSDDTSDDAVEAGATRVEATGEAAKDASEPERPAGTEAAAPPATTKEPQSQAAASEEPPPPAPWQAVPLAVFGGVEVFEISEQIQLIGFHEAAYNVALPLTPTDPPAANHGRGPVHFHTRGFKSVAPVIVLPTRMRESNPASAMDIAVKAGAPVLAPVSGVVTAVLPYSLYNKYPDYRIEIAPAGHPELQVTVLHVTGPQVAVGDTIVAGQTPFAQQATLFPFESQIDRFSKATTGGVHPHVHLEFKYR